MSLGGGGDGGAAEDARNQEEKRQRRIRVGTWRVNDTFDRQFGDDFYAGRRKGFMDYAMPQYGRQYKDAADELVYFLSRNGLLNSTVRTDKEADLAELAGQRQREIADQALGYENDARSAVEQSRANLISTLNVSADGNQAADSAIRQAATLSAPPVYSPLGNLFVDFTSALGQQAALERAAPYGGAAPLYNTGLFGPRGAVSVAR